jgi:hypothetical protein
MAGVPRFAKRAVRSAVLSRAAEELAVRLADQTEQVIDLVVQTRHAAIGSAVEVERLRTPNVSSRELAERLIQQRTRFVAGSGAITSLPAAAPGVGSVVGIGTSLADTAVLLYNEVALVLAIAAAYGRDVSDTDARRFDVLLAFALDAGVAVPAGKTIEVLGQKVVLGALPRDTLAAINKRVGAEVVKRLARRRARAILGRELPLGIGVAIGAGYNYLAVRRIGRTAVKYFEMG